MGETIRQMDRYAVGDTVAREQRARRRLTIPLSTIIGSHLRVASTPNVAFTKVVRSIHLYEWATKRQSG
jgi:hypothetical protein